MVKGKMAEDKNSKTYRSIEVDSYSTLKKFVESPLGYYKQYILGEQSKEKKGSAMVIGDLVDCLLLSPEEYSLKFEEATCGEIDKATAPQGGLFALNLWDVTLENMQDGVILKDFTPLAEEAFNRTKFGKNGEEVAFKGKDLKDALAKFLGTKFEEWYRLQIKGLKKTIIDPYTKDTAQKIVDEIRGNQKINWILQGIEDEEVIFQQQIEFDLYGMECKSMLDILRINHTTRKIRPWDLKCTWEILNFEYNYLKMKYYLQAGVYHKATEAFRDANYPDYEVEPIGFLVADSTSQYEPLFYELNEACIKVALDGFIINNRKYLGVKEIVEDLKWAKETGNFRVKREDDKNNNFRQLNLLNA